MSRGFYRHPGAVKAAPIVSSTVRSRAAGQLLGKESGDEAKALNDRRRAALLKPREERPSKALPQDVPDAEIIPES